MAYTNLEEALSELTDTIATARALFAEISADDEEATKYGENVMAELECAETVETTDDFNACLVNAADICAAIAGEVLDNHIIRGVKKLANEIRDLLVEE
jgi:hypothetical protein